MTNWNEIDHNAKKWVQEAGELIRQSFATTLSIETKSNPNDLVTNIDKETEQFLMGKIKEVYPEHKILGEEGSGHDITSVEGIIWIIDPIDGTMNFIHQKRNFAISVGIYKDGVGQIGLIYDVVHNELYHAVKGQGAFMNDVQLPKLKETRIEEAIISISPSWVTENRRIDYRILAPLIKRIRGTRCFGSTALECAFVASGRISSYITMRLSAWDYAAGLVLLEEVGAVATTVYGEPLNLLENSSFFAGERNVHQQILDEYINK
ncbi:inositol monophosphatase family protein [Metabacillus fastidiosus]|uniref:inositol monophosphatase family protein n=1 Tax=Metabacillus fastidiosus TaxID=1458 RepID=UPI002E2049FF|nr:inositol monophosphatase family protein [Metabacillus fastidiosus]